VYVSIYKLGFWFPVVFALVAGLMSIASFANSKLVMRIGMRRLSHGTLIRFAVMSGLLALMSLFGPVPLPLLHGLFPLTMVFIDAIGSNFNAITTEPLGHLAGPASSVQDFFQTVGAALVGARIGQAFGGTVLPLAHGVFIVGGFEFVFALIGENGKPLGSGMSTPKP
jgi:MFS transporter, DHA1 family, multidrug resistance protein